MQHKKEEQLNTRQMVWLAELDSLLSPTACLVANDGIPLGLLLERYKRLVLDVSDPFPAKTYSVFVRPTPFVVGRRPPGGDDEVSAVR